ncbi:unnamed protein product [Caretta caretta]
MTTLKSSLMLRNKNKSSAKKSSKETNKTHPPGSALIGLCRQKQQRPQSEWATETETQGHAEMHESSSLHLRTSRNATCERQKSPVNSQSPS